MNTFLSNIMYYVKNVQLSVITKSKAMAYKYSRLLCHILLNILVYRSLQPMQLKIKPVTQISSFPSCDTLEWQKCIGLLTTIHEAVKNKTQCCQNP